MHLRTLMLSRVTAGEFKLQMLSHNFCFNTERVSLQETHHYMIEESREPSHSESMTGNIKQLIPTD